MKQSDIEKVEFLLKIKKDLERVYAENRSSIHWDEDSKIMWDLYALRGQIIKELLKL